MGGSGSSGFVLRVIITLFVVVLFVRQGGATVDTKSKIKSNKNKPTRHTQNGDGPGEVKCTAIRADILTCTFIMVYINNISNNFQTLLPYCLPIDPMRRAEAVIKSMLATRMTL
ncbi:hypothetical protein Avbf_08358, partial [Armadillidium vulgare]